MSAFDCKICGNTENNREFHVKEMLLGHRTEFLYFQCSKCMCLQIAKPPANLADYYPTNYYSNQLDNNRVLNNYLKECLKRKRNEAVYLNSDFIGSVLRIFFPIDKKQICAVNSIIDFNFMKRRGFSFDCKVLDVGCGQGFFLSKLASLGFARLKGIDPFVDSTLSDDGVVIEKKTIYEAKEEFDLIVFNHSFEHMPDPIEILKAVSRVLSKKGVCRIRIPIVSSYAWEKYGVNWVQLDAPRHFFLHSLESINLLLEKSRLKLQNIIYDSTEFQFWGSEQYVRDIPLRSPNSYWENPSNSIFSHSQVEEFKKMSSYLNNKKIGDQAAFYITK